LARLTVDRKIPEHWTADALAAIEKVSAPPASPWGYFLKVVYGHADGEGFPLNKHLAALNVPAELLQPAKVMPCQP
jgi:hypothetical protein